MLPYRLHLDISSPMTLLSMFMLFCFAVNSAACAVELNVETEETKINNKNTVERKSFVCGHNINLARLSKIMLDCPFKICAKKAR